MPRYHLSGWSIVTIDGRDLYLGKHDSPDTLARYTVLIATYQTGWLKRPDDFDARACEDRSTSGPLSVCTAQPLTVSERLKGIFRTSDDAHVELAVAD